MPSSQQDPQSPFVGNSSSNAPPAAVALPSGVVPGPEPSGGSFRHATADNVPRPKYETPQEDLEPQADDVTTSAESQNLGSRYVPGSAPGSEAPTVPRLRPTRGR